MTNSRAKATEPARRPVVDRPEQWPFKLAAAPRMRRAAGWLWTLAANLVLPMFIVVALGALLVMDETGLTAVIRSDTVLGRSLFFVAAGALVVAATLAILFIPGALRKGLRLRAVGAVEVLSRDRRAPVLLIRSFDDDHLQNPTRRTVFFLGRERYEESLARALAKVGPVISIGRPGSLEAELGSARLYVEDDDWQSAVSYFMQRSAAVVVIVGHTSGLWWEIPEAFRRVRPERLLFFFPYVEEPLAQQPAWLRFLRFVMGAGAIRGAVPAMSQKRTERYRLFCERCSSGLDHPLPAQLDQEQFLTFSAAGSPRLLETKRPWLSALDLNRYLYGLLKLDFLPSHETEISIKPTLRPWLAELCGQPTKAYKRLEV